MNKKYIQKLAQREKRELLSSYKKGTLYEHITDRAMDIQRYDDDSVRRIVFSIGGLNTFIDFCGRDVYVLAAYNTNSSKAKIPAYCAKELLEILS